MIIATLAILWKLHHQQPAIEPEAISAQLATNETQIASSMPANNSHAVKAIPDSSSITNNSVSDESATKLLEDERNAPIEFYGKVVDQDNNPLAGVAIKAVVVPVFGIVPVERTTETDGRFEISGVKGTGFDLNVIEKAGYEPEPFSRGHGVAGGSLDNPVIFKMWSTNIHEQLITGNKSFEIIPDGRVYFINLTEGTLSEQESGDLKVWIQYTNQVTQGQLYDWSAGIEALRGGLWEVQQTAVNGGFLTEPPFAMYVAPTDGYVPSFSLKQQIKGGDRGEIGNRYFYLRLKGGKEYGRMSINLFAPYGYLHPGLIRIAYAINPSGSRILR